MDDDRAPGGGEDQVEDEDSLEDVVVREPVVKRAREMAIVSEKNEDRPRGRQFDRKRLEGKLPYHATRTREKDSTKEKEEKTIQYVIHWMSSS